MPTAAIIGGGVIGSAWASRLLLNGWEVHSHAAAPNSAAAIPETDPITPAMPEASPAPVPPPSDVTTRPEVPLPVLVEPAARPTPVRIVSPTENTFTIGLTETQLTITFVGEGNGRFDWFAVTTPGGSPLNFGQADTVDITFTLPITFSQSTYLVELIGKNPQAGSDNTTILIVRSSEA